MPDYALVVADTKGGEAPAANQDDSGDVALPHLGKDRIVELLTLVIDVRPAADPEQWRASGMRSDQAADLFIIRQLLD